MKMSLALFITTILLALCAILVVQNSRLVGLKQQLAATRAERDQASRQLEELRASNQQLESRRRDLRRKLDLLTFQAAPVEPAQVPADSTASTNASPAQDQKEGSFGGFLSKMMSDPDTRQFIRDQQRQMMDALYDPLIKRLGLTSEQAAAFKDFLADTQMQGAEKATSMFGGSATNHAEVMAALAAEQKSSDEQIKAFLGEEGYAQYKDYQQTLGERTQLNQFRTQNAGGQNPITDQQIEQLLALMKEEKQNVAAAAGQVPAGAGQDPANLQAMLSGEQADNLLQAQETINQRVYERARSVLAPDQMETFARFQTNQLQMLRLGISMARKFLGPEAGKNQTSIPQPGR